VTPSSRRRSRETTPVLRVRWRKISFLSSRSAYWSMRFGMSAQNSRTRSAKPTGMSSITPPTWK
jgi:hypothetical protein